jgi:hypothetical protein
MAPDAQLYVYAGWPNIGGAQYPVTGASYEQVWSEPSANSADAPTDQVKAYYDNLYDALSTSMSVHIIPVGYVLERLDQEMRAGHISGFGDAYDLYRDPYHLTTDVGRYVAGMTVFSTIFGRSAAGLEIPFDIYANGGQSILSGNPVLRDQLAGLVWDVVSNDTRTGVAPVPLPASAWLLFAGLLGVAAINRGRRLTSHDLLARPGSA